jgi:hypothetical protein
MIDETKRDGLILLSGEDTPDELVDRIADIIGKLAKSEGFEFMVSGCDNDEYDHYDAECE